MPTPMRDANRLRRLKGMGAAPAGEVSQTLLPGGTGSDPRHYEPRAEGTQLGKCSASADRQPQRRRDGAPRGATRSQGA